MSATPKQTIRIYIDNSNVYIEGQKTFSANPREGSSWRYSVINLREMLQAKSTLHLDPYSSSVETKTTVYGSVPPPSDIWKWVEAHNVTVHTFDRSPTTGKEKQVDTKMVADIVRQATIDQYHEDKSEFIIVTGDADIYPAVEYVLKSGFRAHVWSWKTSLSSTYEEVWDVYGLQTVSVYYLDDFRDQFGYQQECHWDIYCKEMQHCRYHHSDKASAYFARNHSPKPLFGYYECKKGEYCDRKSICIYYHNAAERLCPTCDATGRGHGEVGSPEWNRRHNPGSDHQWDVSKKAGMEDRLCEIMKKSSWF